MLILQSGTDVYGISEDKQSLVMLPLKYDKYPTNPTPPSLNTGIAWMLDFLAHNFPYYTILIQEVEGAGGQGGTAAITYINIMNGNTLKKTIAIYTVCNAITMGKEEDLEQNLLTDKELK